MSNPALPLFRAPVLLLALATAVGAPALGCDDKAAATQDSAKKASTEDNKPAAPPELSPKECKDFSIKWVAPLVGTGLDEATAGKMAKKLTAECEKNKQDDGWVKFATCIREKSVIDRSDCFSLKQKDFPL